jgi:hypothetical protein
MRTVAEYIAKAIEFEERASTAADAVLKNAYAELAQGYRILARDRERAIGEGAVKPN